jgi:hypothetical protein
MQYESCLIQKMVRRKAPYVLRKKLPFLGLGELPPEFRRVAPGREWGPNGRALWRSTDASHDVMLSCLSFLACNLEQSSIPAKSGLGHGNVGIFQQPPVLRSDRRSAKNGVCLVFRNARCEGLRQTGRYRQLVLGRDRKGKTVVIGAHRLVCWAVHGPPEEENMVARHEVEGCEQRLACCSPLHLVFGTYQQNRQDVEAQKRRKDLQCQRNLHEH